MGTDIGNGIEGRRWLKWADGIGWMLAISFCMSIFCAGAVYLANEIERDTDQWGVNEWGALGEILAALVTVGAFVGAFLAVFFQRQSLLQARVEFHHSLAQQRAERSPVFVKSTLRLDWQPYMARHDEAGQQTYQVLNSYALSIENSGGFAYDVRTTMIGLEDHPSAGRTANNSRFFAEIAPETSTDPWLQYGLNPGIHVGDPAEVTSKILWPPGPLVIEYRNTQQERRRSVLIPDPSRGQSPFHPIFQGESIGFRLEDDYLLPSYVQDARPAFWEERARLQELWNKRFAAEVPRAPRRRQHQHQSFRLR